MFAFPTTKPARPTVFALAAMTAATAVGAFLGHMVVRVVAACVDDNAVPLPEDDGDYEDGDTEEEEHDDDYASEEDDKEQQDVDSSDSASEEEQSPENEVALPTLDAPEDIDEEQHDVETDRRDPDSTAIDVGATNESAEAGVVAESEDKDKEDGDINNDDMRASRYLCKTPDSDNEGSELDTVTDSSSASSYSDSDDDEGDEKEDFMDSDDELLVRDEKHESTTSSNSSSRDQDQDLDETHHETAVEEDRCATVATATAAELKNLREMALRAENRELSRRLRQVQSRVLKYTESPEYQLMRTANLARRAKLPANSKQRGFRCGVFGSL
ncbi:hypothetical protein Gpo141_00014618, partial [Globisporangium polare]